MRLDSALVYSGVIHNFFKQCSVEVYSSQPTLPLHPTREVKSAPHREQRRVYKIIWIYAY